MLYNFVGTKLVIRRPSERRAVGRNKVAEFAMANFASASYVSASKRLLPDSSEYQDVKSVLSEVSNLYQNATYPYPETGVRLCRKEKLEALYEKVEEKKNALDGAALRLQNAMPRLVREARESLGHLFREEDYPDDIRYRFGIELSTVMVDTPTYLMEISLNLYHKEAERCHAAFSNAMLMAKAELTEKLSDLLDILRDKAERNSMTGYSNIGILPVTSKIRSLLDKIKVAEDDGIGGIGAFAKELEAIVSSEWVEVRKIGDISEKMTDLAERLSVYKRRRIIHDDQS